MKNETNSDIFLSKQEIVDLSILYVLIKTCCPGPTMNNPGQLQKNKNIEFKLKHSKCRLDIKICFMGEMSVNAKKLPQETVASLSERGMESETIRQGTEGRGCKSQCLRVLTNTKVSRVLCFNHLPLLLLSLSTNHRCFPYFHSLPSFCGLSCADVETASSRALSCSIFVQRVLH